MNLMLNPLSKEIKEGISVFTCCMNRNENLDRALATWVKVPQIDEIIILDWSSSDPVKPIADKYNDSRIIVARAEGQERWILSYAFNLAARLTTRKKVLKMDADVKISSDFFKQHDLKNGVFFTGNWKTARTENDKHLNGIVYCRREDFFKINGYNEYITTYGWDDSDLYLRLEKSGLERCGFQEGTLHHLEHNHEERIGNQTISVAKLAKTETSLNFEILKNKFICQNLPEWGLGTQMLEFEVQALDGNRLICHETGERHQVPQHLVDEAETHALQTVVGWSINYWENLPEDYLEIISKSSLYQLYQFFNSDDQSNLDVNPVRIYNQERKFKLLTTLYNEQEPKRIEEYIHCIEQNISHAAIDEIHIFYDTFKDNDNTQILNYLRSRKKEVSDKLHIKYVEGRVTYEDFFSYANQNFSSRNSRVIVCNADIYFNDTLFSLDDYLLNDKFLVLTRWDVLPDASLQLMYQDNKLPNYLTADAWIFETPLNLDFYCKYHLGTWFCDSFFNTQVQHSSLQVFNPCFDVQACHLHWARKDTQEYQERVDKKQLYWQKEYERNNSQEPNSGVVWCHLSRLNQAPNSIFYWKASNLVLRINTSLQDDEKLQSLILFLVIAEDHDKLLWIINQNLTEEILDFLEYLNNPRFNLILDYPSQQNTLIYNGSNEFDFRSDQEIYVELSNAYHDQNVNSSKLDLFHKLYQQFNHRRSIQQRQQAIEQSWRFSTENLSHYNHSVQLGCQSYHIQDFTGMSQHLQNSLEYTPYSFVKTLDDWIEQFTTLSLENGYPFDTRSLHQLPEWKSLINSVLTKKVNPSPLLKQFNYVGFLQQQQPKPKVTIVTSCFKGDQYIDHFLKDITQQTIFSQCELMLINPNSPQNEDSVIVKYLLKYPNIIYIKLDYDPGLYEVWNMGVRLGQGEYATNANLDDRRFPEHLEQHVKALDENPDVDMVSAPLYVTYEKNETWDNNTAHGLWFVNFPDYYTAKDLFVEEQVNGVKTGKIVSQNLAHCMPVWRKNIHEKNGYFDEETYGTSCDWEFWLRCSVNGSKYMLLKEPLGLYLEDPNSHNRRFSNKQRLEDRIVERYCVPLKNNQLVNPHYYSYNINGNH